MAGDGLIRDGQTGGGGKAFAPASAVSDSDAIHDNVASEISAITEKASPVSADLLIIEDSAAANVKKKVQIGNLPGGGGGNSFETINCPSGTDPVADSSTDTLNLVASTGMLIVGAAATDTVTFVVDNVPVSALDNGTDGELITWDAAGAPATVAVGTSGQVLTSNGAGAAPTFQAITGGQTILERFHARSYSAGTARPVILGSTSGKEWNALEFDDSPGSNEFVIFEGVLDDSYGGGGLDVDIYMASTVGSGNMKWDVAIEANAVGQSITGASSFAAIQFTTDTVTTTTIEKITVSFTDGAQMDSLAAGEPFRLLIERDTADAADTSTGHAYFIRAVVKEA